MPAACDQTAVAYARVSTSEQAEGGMSLDAQLDSRPCQHEPLDAWLPRQQRREGELGVDRLHGQRRLAAHVRRRCERAVAV